MPDIVVGVVTVIFCILVVCFMLAWFVGAVSFDLPVGDIFVAVERKQELYRLNVTDTDSHILSP